MPYPGSTMAASPGERRRSGHILAAGERVSLAGDLKAMLWLQGACLEYVQGMPTGLAEDQVLLDTLSSVRIEPLPEDDLAEKALKSGEAASRKSGEATLKSAEAVSQNYLLALQWRIGQKRSVE